MINLILIKNGNPDKNIATKQISISCPFQFDTDLVPLLARAGWEDWDDFYFEIGQGANSIRNGYGVIYFSVSGRGFRQIGLIVKGDRIVTRFGKRVFYSLFVHASGTVAIMRYSLDSESKRLCVKELRPRAYFNNLTDEVVSLRQLQKEKVNLPDLVLAGLARRIVHLGSLITKRTSVSRETISEGSNGNLLDFQEAVARRLENEM